MKLKISPSQINPSLPFCSLQRSVHFVTSRLSKAESSPYYSVRLSDHVTFTMRKPVSLSNVLIAD